MELVSIRSKRAIKNFLLGHTIMKLNLNGLNWSRAYNNEIHNKGYRAGSYAEITVSVLSYLYSPVRE